MFHQTMRNNYILLTVLECLKNETVMLLGYFNARNTVCDNHVKQNTKLGAILEDIIQQH